MKLGNKTITRLNPDLKIRAATWADVNAVAQLIYDVCEADGDVTVAQTPEDIEQDWKKQDFSVETDTFLVENLEGLLVGYGEFINVSGHYHLNMDIYVHPDYKGRGIADTMVRSVEGRCRKEIELAEPGLRVYIRSTMDGKDHDMKKAHEAEGYKSIRFFWRMEINLETAPSAPIWPEGVELRPFIREDHSETLWQADNEAFRDHWGSHDSNFEEWSYRRFRDEKFDPSLWMIAWDGDQIAGYSINRYRQGIGWIGTLGVRRPWRNKGLGFALLKHSFGEFYRRGMKTIGLGVDASNPTGATRLYHKAGMYRASEFVTYEKELRPGKDSGE